MGLPESAAESQYHLSLIHDEWWSLALKISGIDQAGCSALAETRIKDLCSGTPDSKIQKVGKTNCLDKINGKHNKVKSPLRGKSPLATVLLLQWIPSFTVMEKIRLCVSVIQSGMG
jgi:hypothetical protein